MHRVPTPSASLLGVRGCRGPWIEADHPTRMMFGCTERTTIGNSIVGCGKKAPAGQIWFGHRVHKCWSLASSSHFHQSVQNTAAVWSRMGPIALRSDFAAVKPPCLGFKCIVPSRHPIFFNMLKFSP